MIVAKAMRMGKMENHRWQITSRGYHNDINDVYSINVKLQKHQKKAEVDR